VQSLQNVHVLRLLVAEREAALRPRLLAGPVHPRRQVRRWLGGGLVSIGSWIAAEPTAQPARAR
jgi:hypothetical protein